MKDLMEEVQKMESGELEEQTIFRCDDPFYVEPAEEDNAVEQIDDDLDRDRRWGKISKALYVRNRRPMKEWKREKAERNEKKDPTQADQIREGFRAVADSLTKQRHDADFDPDDTPYHHEDEW